MQEKIRKYEGATCKRIQKQAFDLPHAEQSIGTSGDGGVACHLLAAITGSDDAAIVEIIGSVAIGAGCNAGAVHL